MPRRSNQGHTLVLDVERIYIDSRDSHAALDQPVGRLYGVDVRPDDPRGPTSVDQARVPVVDRSGPFDEATAYRRRELSLVRFEELVVDPLVDRGARLEEWQRLSWVGLARRLGITFDDVSFPPCYRWFPYKRWPIRLAPPCEGSMERPDLQGLVDVLTEHSTAGRETPCHCYFTPLSTGNFDETDVRQASLGEVLDVYDNRISRPRTSDRSTSRGSCSPTGTSKERRSAGSQASSRLFVRIHVWRRSLGAGEREPPEGEAFGAGQFRCQPGWTVA